jgi:hypothetical protein
MLSGGGGGVKQRSQSPKSSLLKLKKGEGGQAARLGFCATENRLCILATIR